MENFESLETGDRNFKKIEKQIFVAFCTFWSLFQIWYASPLPFWMNFGILNTSEARSFNLAIGVALIFLGFSAYSTKKSGIPLYDWALAIVGAFSSGYIFFFYAELSDRPGNPTSFDLSVACIGLIVLLEATRRAVGPVLIFVALIFIGYSLAGPYMPEVISHKGVSIQKLMSHQWLSTEGVFGVALGVASSFVFLFVLFGALLESAGAGNYFIKVAFVLLGHLRGGPAKAAVVASGLSGIISGSSIANVVTTGTFTIPLMKRVGFPPYKAAAVEVAASTNGQLTPPVMGAAAFLMVEYVGIPYTDVIKHAILPALISYIALVYIVHLEACKAEMKGIKRNYRASALQSAANLMLVIFLMSAISLVLYYGFGWVKTVLPQGQQMILVMVTLMSFYLSLLFYASKHVHADTLDLSAENLVLPRPGPVIKSGLYFLLPIVVLLWCMAIERLSPASSAFYALCFLIFITLTHRPLLAYFSNERNDLDKRFKQGFGDFRLGLINGSKNMLGIIVATAVAGIIVGTVTLTGLGQYMIALVELLSGDSLMIMLLLTAFICLILGMGLPTTANYIVVSTLMAPVIVTLGSQQGLLVPLISAHMFVFYFGILADDTPPVGLAAFAAAAIAKSNPIKTGIQGFSYDIRTAILPFMFIFNSQLLLIGIDNLFELFMTIITSVIAMLCFASSTQGFWITRVSWWQRILLLLIAFTLFRPDFWSDQIDPPYLQKPSLQLYELIESDLIQNELRLVVGGESLDGYYNRKTIKLPLSGNGTAEEQLSEVGLENFEFSKHAIVRLVRFDSPAAKAGIDFDWEILAVEVKNEQLNIYWFIIPAFLLLFLIYADQRKKQKTLLQKNNV